MASQPKVVILCGGMGTRLREETEFRPKPLVEIGGRPILWHIMKSYAHYGFKNFVLCLGYKGELIKDYFLNYEAMNNDFTISLGNPNKIKIHGNHSENGWTVTLSDTGTTAMTGARIKRIEQFIDGDEFFATYGDGVADIRIDELLEFHRTHGKIATVTGVCPPSRFGELIEVENQVVDFREKPVQPKGHINGGFFVFSRRVFEYLSSEDNCVLEKEPLEQLSKDGELLMYSHNGYWQCMDTYRDQQALNEAWMKKSSPWKVWEYGSAK
ncbi:MAG: glucose-1-phosphate cytidylyltransferase [Nitrospirae bacterium]|nr:glucose-1-phosphate cytidylyltransferase [Nitrospirota bacterium]